MSSDLPAAFVRSIPRALHAILDYVPAIAIVQLTQTIASRFLRPKDQAHQTA